MNHWERLPGIHLPLLFTSSYKWLPSHLVALDVAFPDFAANVNSNGLNHDESREVDGGEAAGSLVTTHGLGDFFSRFQDDLLQRIAGEDHAAGDALILRRDVLRHFFFGG